MTPPADLAAIRALVEAVAQFREAEADLRRHQCRCRDCETSRASSPCGVTYQQNLIDLAKQVLFAALPAAQAAVERVESERRLVDHVLTVLESPLHDADTSEWQRIHGARAYVDCNDYTGVLEAPVVTIALQAARIAQLDRDVAYWRNRAEAAEREPS